ncbi:MAG: PQQ-dependent sugar dehydrogenase [Flavobacteriales bacterium]|nr:PQQ-dependent sugar dehydrogenase [Flavobacteriales bacterium]
MKLSASFRCLGVLAFAFAQASPAQVPVELELVLWSQNLGGAVDVTHCGDDRLFVLRQWGAITIVVDSMVNLSPAFLDITPQVLYNGERGMLGLAFDPDYANNGFFYVSYVASVGTYGTSRLSRFSRHASNPNLADPLSEVVLLSFPQPDPIHQGGGLVFGNDGYLYAAFGDGGGPADPNNTGQDPMDFFGCIIRIKPEPDSTYSIPPDNPFVGSPNGERKEIWAYGLRNPFRIGIDALTGDLWIGDVGQQLWEEIDRMDAGDNSGRNFGWSCYEGFIAFDTLHCIDGAVTTDPIVVQPHSINGGNFCAIIAGEVYRGSQWPRMQGRFFYTDYCTGGLRSLVSDGQGGWIDHPGADVPFPGMSSIGTNNVGELFATNVSFGRVYKIKDKCPMDPPAVLPDGNNLTSSVIGASYIWFLEGDTLQGETQEATYAFVSGNYSVEVTFSNGCKKTSTPYFHLSTSIADASNGVVKVYPQPASASITVETIPTVGRIIMLDITGRVVLRDRTRALQRATLDVSALREGPYILELRNASGDVLGRRACIIAR